MEELTITTTELLIIRNLKHPKQNFGVLKRIVANHYALSLEYINKRHVFDALMNLIEKFDLMPHPWKNVRYFFTDKPSFEPDYEDIWDAWICRASSVIRLSNCSKFPRYPEPAHFRKHLENISHISKV